MKKFLRPIQCHFIPPMHFHWNLKSMGDVPHSKSGKKCMKNDYFSQKTQKSTFMVKKFFQKFFYVLMNANP